MCVYHISAWCLQKPEKDIRYPRIEVRDNCVLIYECWELKLGPLKGQQVLLTTERSPALDL